MNWRHKLLHIDSLGGLSVGLLMLILNYWLSSWYGLPRGFVIFTAIINIAYGSYSFLLLLKNKRPLRLIVLLVIANLTWAVLCVLWVAIFAQAATLFGIIHLSLEAFYVGGLAYLEWRNRAFLLTKPSHLEAPSVSKSS
jgi:hypothetical protein